MQVKLNDKFVQINTMKKFLHVGFIALLFWGVSENINAALPESAVLTGNNLDWLSIPGDLLFTTKEKGQQLETRVQNIELNPQGVTVAQMEATVESLVTSKSPMALNPRGLYVSTNSYIKPDVVVALNGNTYICKATTSVTGLDPSTDTSAWILFVERGQQGVAGHDGVNGAQGIQGASAIASINPRGAYSVTTTYMKNDCVVTSNATYACVKDNTVGIQPETDTTGAWYIFVLRGAQGIQGVQGVQGAPGKDAPIASITKDALAPALQTALNDAAKIVAGSAEGSWGEIDTGKIFRGKKIYRCDYTLYINASANQVADLTLTATPNYVDSIISVGGFWNIGYQTEVHQIPDAGDGTNFAYVLLYGSGNVLTFRSKANNNRSGAMSVIIVEYTKK